MTDGPMQHEVHYQLKRDGKHSELTTHQVQSSPEPAPHESFVHLTKTKSCKTDRDALFVQYRLLCKWSLQNLQEAVQVSLQSDDIVLLVCLSVNEVEARMWLLAVSIIYRHDWSSPQIERGGGAYHR